jgi:hypothetical protein
MLWPEKPSPWKSVSGDSVPTYRDQLGEWGQRPHLQRPEELEGLSLKSAIEWGGSFREMEGERWKGNGTLIKSMSMKDRVSIAADDSVIRSF